MNEFAPGLPSKSKFDPISQSGETRLVIQAHGATTDHFDMRLQDKNLAHSWVIRSLPGEKKKILAIRQPTHTAKYMDFEGTIKSGYGRGTVKKIYDESVNVLEANNSKIKLKLPEGNFVLIKPKQFKKHQWLMVKTAQLAFIKELNKLLYG